jgi:hypothetical protein
VGPVRAVQGQGEERHLFDLTAGAVAVLLRLPERRINA